MDSQITRYQKNKNSYSAKRPVHSGKYGPIKQPYIRRLSRLVRSAGIFALKVSDFRYFSHIFLFVMFQMKNFETYTIDRCH